MNRVLYFNIPWFGRRDVESLIINELKCPCYKMIGELKYFSDNEHLWIVMRKRVVTVAILSNNEDIADDLELDIRKAFYGDDALS